MPFNGRLKQLNKKERVTESRVILLVAYLWNWWVA